MRPAIAPKPPSPEAELWIRARLARSMMQSIRTGRIGVIGLILMCTALLWGHVPAVLVLGWGGVSLSLALARLWVFERFDRVAADAPASLVVAAISRVRWLGCCSAVAWGALAFLQFDRVPLTQQFLCWMAVGTVAQFSVNGASRDPRSMRAYVNLLMATSLAGVLWRIAFELRLQGPPEHAWLVALLVLWWLTLRHVGAGLYRTHRQTVELQWRNQRLIDSLTRQTAAALEAIQIKNRFLASAAHDLRQPVHALGLYADWLSSEPALAAEIAPRIVQATRAVNTMFDALFDLARLEAGQMRVDVREVQLAPLLHELEVQYRPLAMARGLRLRVRATPGSVRSDPILLRRIAGNLLANAIKYTERGGVLLAARSGGGGGGGGGLRLEVWDTGVGIDPEHQREVFQAFYKAPAHAGTDDGFGLGLAIVARLAHVLGHPVTLRSRPGRGTLVRLDLLAVDEAAATRRATAVAASANWSAESIPGELAARAE